MQLESGTDPKKRSDRCRRGFGFRHQLVLLADGRYRPRRPLGPNRRRFRRRSVVGVGNSQGDGKRIPGRRPVGAEHRDGLRQALRAVRRIGSRTGLQHGGHEPRSNVQLLPAAVQGGSRSRRRQLHVVVQRRGRNSGDRQPLAANRRTARPMEIRRVRGFGRRIGRRNDRPRHGRPTAGRGAGAESRARHGHGRERFYLDAEKIARRREGNPAGDRPGVPPHPRSQVQAGAL